MTTVVNSIKNSWQTMFRFCLTRLFFSGDCLRLRVYWRWLKKEFFYRPDAFPVAQQCQSTGMVWYGIVEFNVPPDTV